MIILLEALLGTHQQFKVARLTEGGNWLGHYSNVAASINKDPPLLWALLSQC